jgi:prophage DNA circulation protein
MNLAKRKVEAAALRAALAGLIAAPSDRTTLAASALRRAAGELSADAESALEAGTAGTRLRACFTLLLTAGTTLSAVDGFRARMSGYTGTVADVAFWLSLIATARIIADTQVRSRADAQDLLAYVAPLFQGAIDAAGDRDDSAIYLALVSLRASVTRDLVDRGRTLPQVVAYAVGSLPAVALAQRLYADATRSDELISENRVIHPAFMPATGVAFSE